MKRIGLIYDRIRWEEKEIIKATKKRGLELIKVDSKEVFIDLSEKPRKIEERFGSLVLQRCISYFRGLHISAVLENNGLYVINPFSVSSLCGNKLFSTLSLVKYGIPVPASLVAFTRDGALNGLENLGYPNVIKPVVGSWGRLIALLKDKEAARAVIESRDEMRNALLQIFYFQKYVERPPRDIRVLVIGEEVIAASYRYSAEDEWRTNVARGATSRVCPLTEELKEIVLKTSEAVGGGVLAVDCMESPEGLVVNEVNSTVEFRGLSTATGLDIAIKIIDYALKVLKK